MTVPAMTGPVDVPRLDVLKALGDNTRYAIYLELARSSQPLTTSEVADRLGLHPNTVRPHLDRMRDVGLLQVDVDGRGEVGRPQHRYSLAALAPSLGFEPPAAPMLANMLLRLAERSGLAGTDAEVAGRAEGASRARGFASVPSTLEAFVGDHEQLGFDPVVSDGPDDDTAVVAFANCPFRAHAEAHTSLVCAMHRGLVEGFVDDLGDAVVTEFCDLAHRTPCQVSVTSR
jgi:predicted ArsR family transcriptional regulator